MINNCTYAGGTFDLFHAGHVEFFKQVKYATDDAPLIVSVNTDEFAARYKRKPILTLDERVEALQACRYIDWVCVNIGDEDSKVTIVSLATSGKHVRRIAHGDDWVGPGLMQQMGITPGWLAQRGIGLLHVPYTEGISTGEIINRVLHEYTPKGMENAKCCGDPGDCSC